MIPSCDLFVVVGEASGDAYAAAIVERLLASDPEVSCAAMGGRRLQDAGAEIDHDIAGLDVMGFLPVLARLPEFLRLMGRVATTVRQRRPRVVLTVDYPGFNLRLVRRLRARCGPDIRFVHVVAPQVWAWRPRRAKKIAASVDRLLCFFPFEPPLFRRYGAVADFVGHPLVDLVAGDAAALPDPDRSRRLVLAPGSRTREVREVLPVMEAAVELALPLLRRSGPVEIAVSRAPGVSHSLYRECTDLPIDDRPYRQQCREARAALVTSGTATLEAALLGVPHVICYRGDAASARVAQHLIRTRHIGLPNIIHRRRVCPEVIQDELTPERLAVRLVQQWRGPRRREARAVLATTGQRLGGGGAMERIAALVAEELRGSANAPADATEAQL